MSDKNKFDAFNPYKILEINFDADQAEIRQAFRKKVRTTHQDSGGSNEAFQDLKRAYDLLSDPESKRLYDDTGQLADTPIDPQEAKIIDILSIAIDKSLFKCATDPNHFQSSKLLELMLMELNEKKQDLSVQKINYDQALYVSQDLLNRFLVTEGRNLIRHVILDRIRICQTQIDQIVDQLNNIEEALNYLQKTEFQMPLTIEFNKKGAEKQRKIYKGYHPLLDWGDLINFRFSE